MRDADGYVVSALGGFDVERPCRVERTSLGGGWICAECGSDCECVVCIGTEGR